MAVKLPRVADNDTTVEEAAARSSGWEWDSLRASVGAFATGAAVLVGMLYAVGAILIAGDLRSTGVAMSDALPLVPLHQMLGRGMSVLLSSPGLVVAFLAEGALFVAMATDTERRRALNAANRARRAADRRVWRAELEEMREELRQHPKPALGAKIDHAIKQTHEASRRDARAPFGRSSWLALFLVPAALMGLLAPPWMCPFWFLAVIFLGVGFVGRAAPIISTLAAAGSLFLGILLSAYYYAPGLPNVVVTTTDSAAVTGGLVTQTGDGIYVAAHSGRLLTVPTSVVSRVEVAKRPEEKKRRTTIRRIWSAIS